MAELRVASFNAKNLIGPDQEYYRWERYTPEEFRWKRDWMAEQILSLDADVIGFQEIFEEEALADVVAESDRRAGAPDPHRTVRFSERSPLPYGEGAIAFGRNASDHGDPGHRRPGVAVLSRLGFVGDPEVIQILPEPLEIPFRELNGAPSGSFTLTRTSRPILKVRVPMGDHVVSVFTCHLKSRLGEYMGTPGQRFSPEANLLDYEPLGRALGAMRSAVRRMAEAWVLRHAVVASLRAGEPVIVMGDLNAGQEAVSTEIIAGERPFRNYAWLRRHDAEGPEDHYTDTENQAIRASVEALQLHSAETLFARRAARPAGYTTSFGGSFESIDQILLSRHFLPQSGDVGEMTYFSTLNDHLADGSHPEAPYNRLVSDHGQIMAHLEIPSHQEA